jgi:hypothetical protein
VKQSDMADQTEPESVVVRGVSLTPQSNGYQWRGVIERRDVSIVFLKSDKNRSTRWRWCVGRGSVMYCTYLAQGQEGTLARCLHEIDAVFDALELVSVPDEAKDLSRQAPIPVRSTKTTTYRSGKYSERPHKIHGECECGCGLSDHRQAVIMCEDGSQEVVPMECRGCSGRCNRFETRTCCGHCKFCNWGGAGPPAPGLHDSELAARYYSCDGTFVGQLHASHWRAEMVRRGMPDPAPPGLTSGSHGRPGNVGHRWSDDRRGR